MTRVPLALLTVIALTAAAHAQAITLQDGFAPIVEKIQPAVVRIHVVTAEGEGVGSGVIVSEDGLIITNNHVVEAAESATVTLHDKRELEAKLIGTDPESDIAVIRIAAKGLPHATFADSSKVRVGEFALALGSPLDLEESVSLGIVSAVGRRAGFQEFIQTDAAVNRGNSGGPLVNAHGEIIGINSMILSHTGDNSGIAFAVSSNLVKDVMGQLVASGQVTRGFLGVRFADTDKGIYVVQVTARTPAAKAGLRNGDFVYALDGQHFGDSTTLTMAIAGRKPGSHVKLGVVRHGKKSELEAILAARPRD